MAAVAAASVRLRQTGSLMAQVEDYRTRLADSIQKQNAFASQADECKAQVSDAFLRAGTSDAEAHTIREEATKETTKSEANVAALQTQVADIQIQLEPPKRPNPPAPLYLSDYVLADLKAKGLKDPANDIVADLMKHNELI